MNPPTASHRPTGIERARIDRSALGVAVFVKTPGLSPIKTRLALGIGQERAESGHLRCAFCVAELVREAGVAGYWAVAETEALEHPLWRGLPRLAQGTGSLGRRMAQIHTRLLQQHPAALLLGADLPQLETRHLHAAAAWLNSPQPRAILGPARDGGFWLFGANRSIAEGRWTSVSYSRADTAEAFRAALGEDFEWHQLELLTDLDTVEDLARVRAELQQLVAPLPCQIELRDWLAALPGADR